MKMIALEVFSFLHCHLIKENTYANNDSSRPLNESNRSLSLLPLLEPIVNNQDTITWLNSMCMGFNFKDLLLTRIVNTRFLKHVFRSIGSFIQIAGFACNDETSVK